MFVRLARREDGEAGLDIARQAWLATYVSAEHGISRADIESVFDLASPIGQAHLDRFRALCGEPPAGTCVWVVVVDEQVAGFAWRVVTSAACKRSTCGRRFTAAASARCSSKRRSPGLGTDGDIVLNVVSYNDKAIRFYERHGFVRSGRAGHSAITLPNGLTLPEIEMVRPART